MSYIFTKADQSQIAESIKKSVRVASIANVDLLATHTTLDGKGLNDGDRVLLKNQSLGAENGMYTWDSSSELFTRVSGLESVLTSGMLVVVEEGTSQDTLFVLATENPIVVGITTLSFSPMAGGGAGGEVNTGSNVGTGRQVFKQKTGVDLEFRTLTPGSNVSLTQNANDIQVSSTGEANTASNLGAGRQIFKQKTGVDLELRSLIQGSNVTLVEGANDITVSATGEANTASNIGTGRQVFKQKTVSNLELRTFVEGSNVTLVQNANDITVSATGEANTASNLGAGRQIFKQKTGVDLELRSLVQGSNVTLVEGASDITVSATGEANTASNLGAGRQVFKQKTGVDLELRSLVQGANVTLVEGVNDITISATGGGTSPSLLTDPFFLNVAPSDPSAADDSDLSTPFITIQGAVDALEALPARGVVHISQGDYPETVRIKNDQIDLVGEGVVRITPATGPCIVLSNATDASLAVLFALNPSIWKDNLADLIEDVTVVLPRTNKFENLRLVTDDGVSAYGLVVIGAGAGTEFGRATEVNGQGFQFLNIRIVPDGLLDYSAFFATTNIIHAFELGGKGTMYMVNVSGISFENCGNVFYDEDDGSWADSYLDIKSYYDGGLGFLPDLGDQSLYFLGSIFDGVDLYGSHTAKFFHCRLASLRLYNTLICYFENGSLGNLNLVDDSSVYFGNSKCEYISSAEGSSLYTEGSCITQQTQIASGGAGTFTSYGTIFGGELLDSGLKRMDYTADRLNIKATAISLGVVTGDGINTVVCTAAPVTVTLPPADNDVGRVVTVKKGVSSASAITLTAQVGETIDGVLSTTISTDEAALTVQSAGAGAWFIIRDYQPGGVGGVPQYEELFLGIAGTPAGESFILNDSTPPLELQVVCTGSSVPFVGPALMDSDGTYIAWTSGADPNIIRLCHVDTGHIRTITPSAVDLASLFMDGERIYCTDGVNFFIYEYDGTQLYNPAEDGIIMDVSQGCAVIWDSAAEELSFYNATASKTSIIIESDMVVQQAIGVPNSSGFAVLYLSLDVSMGPHLRLDGPGVTSAWDLNISVQGLPPAFGGLWYHDGYATMVSVTEMYGPELTLIAVDTSADSSVPITQMNYDWVASPFRLIEQVFSFTTPKWVMTPKRIACLQSGNLFIWDRSGNPLGVIPIPRSPTILGCDGQDILIGVISDGSGIPPEAICRMRVGNESPTVRTYSPTDWRPLCRSLGIGE